MDTHVLETPVVQREPARAQPPSAQKDKTPIVLSVDPEKKRLARGQLTKIAEGALVSDVVSPQPEAAPLPDRETVTQLLKEANQLLLESQDIRLLISSLATQAADTPLGNELRIDALEMLSTMSNEGMPPDAAVNLSGLQKKIGELQLPPRDPAQSALADTLEGYNASSPKDPVPDQLIADIRSGKRETAKTLGQLLQTGTGLSEEVWKDLTGIPGFTGLAITPEHVLQLAELDTTEANKRNAEAMFGVVAQTADHGSIVDKLVPPIMAGAMLIMFFSQIATGEQQQGH